MRNERSQDESPLAKTVRLAARVFDALFLAGCLLGRRRWTPSNSDSGRRNFDQDRCNLLDTPCRVNSRLTSRKQSTPAPFTRHTFRKLHTREMSHFLRCLFVGRTFRSDIKPRREAPAFRGAFPASLRFSASGQMEALHLLSRSVSARRPGSSCRIFAQNRRTPLDTPCLSESHVTARKQSKLVSLTRHTFFKLRAPLFGAIGAWWQAASSD
jgi:hypothetical protein